MLAVGIWLLLIIIHNEQEKRAESNSVSDMSEVWQSYRDRKWEAKATYLLG